MRVQPVCVTDTVFLQHFRRDYARSSSPTTFARSERASQVGTHMSTRRTHSDCTYAGDVLKLRRDYRIDMKNVVDLATEFLLWDPSPWRRTLPPPGKRKPKGKPRRQPDDLVRFQPVGLFRLAGHYLNLYLDKPKKVRTSDWFGPLAHEQILCKLRSALP